MKDSEKGLFDSKTSIKAVVWSLVSISFVLFLLDFWTPKEDLHFGWESGFGFYAVFGFVACVSLVLIAKYILRPLVMRKEDYYDQ